jgi:hypothetical protein
LIPVSFNVSNWREISLIYFRLSSLLLSCWFYRSLWKIGLKPLWITLILIILVSDLSGLSRWIHCWELSAEVCSAVEAILQNTDVSLWFSLLWKILLQKILLSVLLPPIPLALVALGFTFSWGSVILGSAEIDCYLDYICFLGLCQCIAFGYNGEELFQLRLVVLFAEKAGCIELNWWHTSLREEFRLFVGQISLVITWTDSTSFGVRVGNKTWISGWICFGSGYKIYNLLHAALPTTAIVFFFPFQSTLARPQTLSVL